VGEGDQGVAADAHRGQLIAVGGVIGAGQDGLDLRLEVEHPAPVDLVIEDGVPGGALLHELREHPCIEGG